ncbi:abscission/NoCut checkpoint regulator isoform X2 [Linepithema humile]|nr:PREDICTED: abscission/NoCut checkpoint regulator isoform X2 [Linepithema humile]
MNKSTPETTTTDAIMSNVDNEPLAPVDITMKLDLLENPAKPPIVMYKHTNHWDKFKKGLEPADQQIVDRLRKLKDKERSIPLPTVEEIKQRLASLKDQEASGSNIINIHQLDTRTDQEKTDDLIQEYLAQLELPSTSDPFKEIQERLNSLRDEDDKSCSDPDKKEEIDIYKKKLFEMINEKFIDKLSAMEIETSPNVKDEAEDDADDDKDDDDDDENECVMCSRTTNEMDLYRCTGCTGDLYCPTCFESSHDEAELDKHKAVRFVKQVKDR